MGPGIYHSKPNEARLVERKVYFISYSGNCGGRGRMDICPKADYPPSLPLQVTTNGTRALLGWGRGLHAETAPSALTVIFRLVISGLTTVMLIVLIQFGLFPFLWGQFLELWQLVSQLQSGHHVLTSSTSWGFQYLWDRIWLWIISIAFEKELKVFDYA